jgi:tRNA(Met) C34 N-acetyltransferase TmcA
MAKALRIAFLELNSQELAILLTPFDLKRLESYANNMLDYHVILDLLPIVASVFFQRRLGDDVRLTAVQSSILLALGLQKKTIEDVEVRLLPSFLFAKKLTIHEFNRRSSTYPSHRLLHYSSRSSEKSPIG